MNPDGAVALVSDSHVAGIHGVDAQLALGARLAQTYELPPGEEAKTLAALDHLWQELRLVLLGDEGPRVDVPVPAADVRRALDELIA